MQGLPNAGRLPIGFGDVGVATVFDGYLGHVGFERDALAVEERDVLRRRRR